MVGSKKKHSRPWILAAVAAVVCALLVTAIVPSIGSAATTQSDKSLYGLLNWLQSDDCTVELTEAQLEEVKSADEFLDKLIGYGYIDPDDEDDAVSLELVKDSLGFIDELNEYRASDDNYEGYSDVVTNWTMLVGSAGTADVSIDSTTHVSNTSAYNYFRREFASGENLAWGGSDPMNGWYVAEKVLFDKAKENLGYSGYLTSEQISAVVSEVSSIVAEEGTNGIYYVKVNGLSYPLTGVGHYTNLFYAKTQLAGIGYTTETGDAGFSKTFSYNPASITSSSVTYTTSEIRAIITEYECWLEGHSYDYADIEWTWTDDYSSATATVTCSTCGSKLTVEAEVTSSTTEATCTEAGSTVYTATITDDDGTSYTDTKTVTVDALGHSLTKTEQVDASCTEDGTEAYWTCSTCGKLFSDEEGTTEIDAPVAIEATGHSWGDGVVTTEATCTEDGVMTYTCTACSETKTEAIDATGHSWGDGMVTEPTCTEAGYTTYTCSACGETKTEDETEAKGHSYDYTDVSWTWATDYSSATATVTCENDSSHTLTAEATVTSETTDATCNEAGATVYTATATFDGGTAVSTTATVATDATGHTAADAVVENEVAATCTIDGSYDSVVYCSVCGAELSRETVTVEATGHTAADAVVENEVEATCETDGSYDSVVYCTVCSAELSRETVTVEAAGHSWNDGVVTEATCTEGGYTTYTCSVCGGTKVEDETVALGHSYDYTDVSWTWATDYSSATATVTCTVCGDAKEVAASVTSEVKESSTCNDSGVTVYTATATLADGTAASDMIEVATDATGHTAGEAVIENEVAATCTEEGSYQSVTYCTVCNAEISRETVTTDALGHSWDEGTVTTEATCTTDGTTTYTCTTCGETKTETIEATGHSWGEGVVAEEATCESDGTTTYTCSVCGETKTEAIAATGHTEGEAVVENEVEATETEDGSYESVVYCSVCGEEISRETVTVPATGTTDDEDATESEDADADDEESEEDVYIFTDTDGNEYIVTDNGDGTITLADADGNETTYTVTENDDGTITLTGEDGSEATYYVDEDGNVYLVSDAAEEESSENDASGTDGREAGTVEEASTESSDDDLAQTGDGTAFAAASVVAMGAIALISGILATKRRKA